jgi:very-short-patch-repair endonuclease
LGEGEHAVEMNIFVDIQSKIFPPLFLSRCFSRETNGRGWEGAIMPRPLRSNPHTKHKAIQLRKESTLAEQKLWSRIRNDQLGVSFRRQHAIGKYIPDFCAPKAKLIIELDGSQHLIQKEYDTERTKYLESLGYKVLRFWNHDVMKDIEGVIRAIIRAMEADHPPHAES